MTAQQDQTSPQPEDGAHSTWWWSGGQLMLRTLSPTPGLYRGLRLHPDDEDDPYIFRIDLSRYGLGTAGIVFSRNGEGATTGVHFDAGVLLSAEKRSSSQPSTGRPA